MRRRERGFLAGLLLAVTVTTGCTEQDNGGRAPVTAPNPPATTANPIAGAPDAGPPSFGPGIATVMWCGMSGDSPFPTVAILSSYRIADGARTGERTISFGSAHAEPDYLCSPADEQRSAQQVRQLFDRNHTLVAGTVPGPPGRGHRAAAFDLTTGRPVGPPPPADEFASSAAQSESAPLFGPGTDTLWYQAADKRVLSRDPRNPTTPPRERGRSSTNSFLLFGETVWTPATDVEMVSPAGDVAVAYEHRRGMRLVRNVRGSGVDPAWCRRVPFRDDARMEDQSRASSSDRGVVLIGEEAALARAGVDLRVYGVGGALVAVGGSAVVVIAEVGDDPEATGVRNGRTLEIVGPGPRAVSERLFGPGPDAPGFWRFSDDRPIHLFVRTTRGLIDLGSGSVTSGEMSLDGFVACTVWIERPLDPEVLDLVRPPSPHGALPDVAWLDHVRGDRARALRMFITGWHPAKPGTTPVAPTVDAPELPAALAEFLRLAEDRPDILGVQDFIDAEEVRADPATGLLWFGRENQGGFVWALDPTLPDPTVWLSEDFERWYPEREPLSGFLLQYSLQEAALGAPYAAFGDGVPVPLLEAWLDTQSRVPLRTWAWHTDPTSFHVSPGLITMIRGETNDHTTGTVRIGAKHRDLLRPLTDSGIDWTTFDG
ncbi:hypothetical protein ACIRL2_50860 [Embleya sp. NPDC127516]|uniref:hypothetical protein n=1 Tax=Embleya sp. NPDC127516 TaxID=3363990 RepID=UPI003822D8CC